MQPIGPCLRWQLLQILSDPTHTAPTGFEFISGSGRGADALMLKMSGLYMEAPWTEILPFFRSTFPFNSTCEPPSALKPFRGRSRPTAAICAPHLVQRLKMESASRRIFLVRLEQPTHERAGGRNEEAIWRAVRRRFQDKEQLTRASQPATLLPLLLLPPLPPPPPPPRLS